MMNEEGCSTNAVNNHGVAPIKPNRFLSAAATTNEGADMAGDPKHTLFEIDSIIGHCLDTEVKTLFQLLVKWKDGDETWEPEDVIQEDAEEALFAYWGGVDRGRLGAMVDKDLWHALKIQSHRQTTSGAVELEVIWVGSPVRSWEPKEKMLEVAPEVVNEYWGPKEEYQKCIKDTTVPAKRSLRACRQQQVGQKGFRNGLRHSSRRKRLIH
ncbi:hypothetical protein LZ30DRAFT_672000 [Colletotrichum cereale]|nr:hypothetical protein LZ30DRAFT_672000 [Colletotrichum cereale]